MKLKKQTKINRFEWVRFVMSFKSLLNHCDNQRLEQLSNILIKEVKKRGF